RSDSCRAPIAVGLARQILGSQARVESVGIMPKPLHPLAARVMQEINIDVSSHEPREIDLSAIDVFDMVVVVEPRNPFAGNKIRPQFLHWPLPDPLDPPADDHELFARVQDTRTALGKHIKSLA